VASVVALPLLVIFHVNTIYAERIAIYGYGLVGCKAVCIGYMDISFSRENSAYFFRVD
jgi:hypothetical protein